MARSTTQLLVSQAFHNVPVKVTTTSQFLRQIEKKTHLTRETVTREIYDSLDELLISDGMSSFSPDKSDRKLDSLELSLFAYEQEGFSNGNMAIRVNPPKTLEFEGTIGWANEIYLEGNEGIYILQVLNGYFYLS